MATVMRMTKHAYVDRFDRLAACVELLGYNEIIYERPDSRNSNVINCITDTGIVFVRAADDGKIITGYMATVKQLVAIYQGHVPQKLFNAAVKNNKKFAFLLEM